METMSTFTALSARILLDLSAVVDMVDMVDILEGAGDYL